MGHKEQGGHITGDWTQDVEVEVVALLTPVHGQGGDYQQLGSFFPVALPCCT